MKKGNCKYFFPACVIVLKKVERRHDPGETNPMPTGFTELTSKEEIQHCFFHICVAQYPLNSHIH
jgi:hypothetical protein